MPPYAATECPVTATPVETLADLETRDRARAQDVRECDTRRALAVWAHEEQARLVREWLEARERRAGWACRVLGWGCGG